SRLQHPHGCALTKDEIMAIVRGGKPRGHIPGVGRVLPGQGTVIPPPSQSTHSADIARLKKPEWRVRDDEPGDDEDDGEDEDDS
nr:F-box domain, leucine-rich repeat domain, L domain-like protein [Tanacetum cinerariifolium]